MGSITETITAAAKLPRPGRLIGLIAASLLLTPGLAHAQLPRGEFERALDGDSKRDGELREFYARRAWQPLWLKGRALAPEATTLFSLVERADADGLNRSALRVTELAATLRRAEREPSPRSLARAEMALSRAFAAFVQGTRTSRNTGMKYQSSLLQPVVPSVLFALETAAAAPSLQRYLETLGWMHPIYGELRQQLATGTFSPEQQRRIVLNLERARALPVNPAPRYVLIDAAGARLWMYEEGKPVGSMNVVVGKPDQPTPMVAGVLTNAVLNPYWNVPSDLVRTRIAASVLDQGLGYLRHGGYQVFSDYTQHAQLLDPARVDWKAVAAGQSEVRVRQLPGKANFMGEIKFNFPNNDGIYLHDTPEKALLKKDVRTASAGCVRLEDAAGFGRWLFGKPLVAKPKLPEQVVPLEERVPVYITYLTAAPSNGQIVFREDVYLRDEAQLAMLGEDDRGAR